MLENILLNGQQCEVKIYSVSELAFSIKSFIEENFEYIKIRGEVQDCKVHSSGHVYFVLKDSDSVIDAICWKGVHFKAQVKLEDGLEIICNAKVTTYPMRSKYQIVVNSYEIFGKGALLKLIDDRKKKLYAEGIFANKRNLPFLPKTIGVITSPTGAVIRDILHRVNDRNNATDVLIWPVLVQGIQSSEQIVAAIKGFNSMQNKPEIIIIARGGGSLEDLMPFNDEVLCREIFKSSIPVVTAVGHETDTTLADLAADMRAPTPTAAAEMVIPVRLELALSLDNLYNRVSSLYKSILQKKQLQLDIVAKSLPSIKSFLELKIQTLDYVEEKLKTIMVKFIDDRIKKMNFLETLLDSYSYKNVLTRGFVLALDGDGCVIKSVAGVSRSFNVRFVDGSIKVNVDDGH